ncbi:putative 50S ribosomal subunit protein L21 (plasmid) [Candidatus Tremblaya phenacola PAVE]|nr:putative 50S ribosomal subunit protein L21 [Candidatus Tremblaya phenacola PAVE]
MKGESKTKSKPELVVCSAFGQLTQLFCGVATVQGKQHFLSKSKRFAVQHLSIEEGRKFYMPSPLFKSNNKFTNQPSLLFFLPSFTTTSTSHFSQSFSVVKVLKHKTTPKVVVLKFRRRKNYRRREGHKQDTSQLQVEKIRHLEVS